MEAVTEAPAATPAAPAAAKTAIDLDGFDTVKGAEEGAETTLIAPSGAELKGFMVRGYDSPTYQRALQEQSRKFLKQGRQRKVPSTDELEAEGLELAGLLLIGWPDHFTLGGQPFPYSHANAVVFLKRFPWAREQIEGVARERANFLPKSSKG